jgi:S1-C subfamily serine protease
VYADNVVLTTVRALGRGDGLHVRRDDGRTFEAELAGWDPTTSLAVLRVNGLETPPLAPSASVPRVGQLALAVARSWSNVVTASAGIVSISGRWEPATGRDRSGDPRPHHATALPAAFSLRRALVGTQRPQPYAGWVL